MLLCVAGMILLAGYSTADTSNSATGTDQYRPRLFMALPDYCNQPDGMTFDPETNDIYLSCPNFNNPSYPGVIMKFSTDNELSFFCTVPVDSETKRGCPMGLDFGPDGNLYYADNQYFYDKNYKSRLMRVNIEDGKAVSIEPVVLGFKLSNAVIWKDDAVYVSDTFFDILDKPGMSGIYKIKLSEMRNGPVKLKPGERAVAQVEGVVGQTHRTQRLNASDSHLIATFQTMPNKRNDFAGADGLTFDSKGNLYTGNFGDGALSRITFDENGKVASNKVICKSDTMSSIDGLFCDLKNDYIYIADYANNAIHVYSPDGKLTTLWENGDTDGADGLLDGPCEVLIRGNELIVVNFDMPFPGVKNTEYDEHHTLSVINPD